MCTIAITANLIRPSYHQVCCDQKLLHLVLCEKPGIHNKNKFEEVDIVSKTSNLPGNTFNCSDGMLVSTYFLCDGLNNCKMSNDDKINCGCKVNNKFLANSSFCFLKCHSHNCSCSPLHWHMRNGGCKQYSSNILSNKNETITSDPNDRFNCTESVTIPRCLFNDLILDCDDGRDEPLLQNIDRQAYNCQEVNMIECYPGHTKCYKKEQQCQYNLDGLTHTLLYCRNG